MSGYADDRSAIPSGAAISERTLIRGTPQARTTSQALAADPPVASIGSTIRASVTPQRVGSLL